MMSAEKPRPKATGAIVDDVHRLKRNLLKSETECDRLKARNLKLVEAMGKMDAWLAEDGYSGDYEPLLSFRAAIEENDDGK